MNEEYLGKQIMVTVDRPIFSKHPKFNFEYELNYGYIKGTISGDGEELDAYILGEDKPLKEFYGTVIAIIHRTNDDDDKLVVANKNYTDEEIKKLTYFQEKWFKSYIIRK